MPSEISIRGRTIHWFTYSVQQVEFHLDGFNEEGYPIYAGIQKKMVKITGKPRYGFPSETDPEKFQTIYLTHDNHFDAGENVVKAEIDSGELRPGMLWNAARINSLLGKMQMKVGYWLITANRDGGYAYAKVCSNGTLFYILKYLVVVKISH